MTVVVITGASSGIGEALALNLAAKGGFKLVLVARRTELLDAIVAKIGGANALAVTADVTVRAQVKAAVDAAVQRFGTIDVWVNNAGRGHGSLPSELTEAAIDEQINVNVKSALYGFQEVLPVFKANGKGHIATTSSVLGRLPIVSAQSHTLVAYSAAKHYLNALVATFRAEYAAYNVTVSLLSPGLTQTDFGAVVGMDIRKIPGAQDVAEVAEIYATEVIINRKPDVFTRDSYREGVRAYYGAL